MDRRQEMLLLREQKYTLQFIGDKFGISRERVRQIIGNTGYAAFSTFYREEELQEVQRYFAITRKEVAKLYYLTQAEIGRRQKKSAGYVRGLRKNNNLFKCYSCTKILSKSYFYQTKIPLEKVSGLKCKECSRKYSLKYTKIYNKKLGLTEIGKLKARAHSRVQNAKKRGKLIVGECAKKDQNCKGRMEANHWHGYEYEHQLDVQWLCHYHHSVTDKFGFKYIKH